LTHSIKKGIRIKGLAFIEVLLPCATNFGRYVLKTGDPGKVQKWINDRVVTIKKAESMSPEELKDKVLIGEFVERERPGVVESYQSMLKRLKEV
jgi:2-oxoglutarate ferredoxin oxidoreductase subunit beta